MPEIDVFTPEKTDNESVWRNVDTLCQVLVKYTVQKISLSPPHYLSSYNHGTVMF